MIAISRKLEQNSAYATKRGPYGAPDTGLDHSKETYRRDYVARDAATGRRHADTSPPLLRQLINFRGQHEIQVGQSARGMRRQDELHRIPSDVDIRVMIHSLRFFRQLVYELNRG